jgi:hypothetical protein
MKISDTSLLQAMLTSKKYNNTYNAVPNDKIGTELKEEYTRLLEFVGMELNESTPSLFTVKSQNGLFQRLYEPFVCRTPNEENLEKFTILGKDLKTEKMLETDSFLKIGQTLLIPLKAFVDNGAEIDFESSENSAPRLALILPHSEIEEELCFYFSLYVPDLKNSPKPVSLRKALKDNKLGEYLLPPSVGSPTIKLTELDEYSEHSIVDYEARESQFGLQFTLVRDDGVKIFSNSAINSVLKANPLINRDNPAKLFLGAKKETKNKNLMIEARLTPSKFNSSSGIDLDW